MDFSLLILLLCALIILICLGVYLKVAALLKISGRPLDSNNTLELKIIAEKLSEFNTNQNTLRMQLAEQLNQESMRTKELFNTSFTKSQDLGFSQLTAVNKGLAEMTERMQTRLDSGLKLMAETTTNQLTQLSRTNQERLATIQESVEKRMDENLKRNLESFTVVKEDLVKMQHSAAKMIDSTKSIERLNDVFGKGASKSFGTFGEDMLAHFLRDNIPNSFDEQYQIPGSAEKIDFCIRFADQKIGVDSKFPLESYQNYHNSDHATKDTAYKSFMSGVKFMIEDISKKYVASQHFDQVYIYFPSDSIYLEVVNDATISEFLRKKSVHAASPSTIFPMLAVIAQYNQRVMVNENAEVIIRGMQKIGKHIDAFREEFRKLGDKLRLAQDNYFSAERSLEGVNREVVALETTQSPLKELE